MKEQTRNKDIRRYSRYLLIMSDIFIVDNVFHESNINSHNANEEG